MKIKNTYIVSYYGAQQLMYETEKGEFYVFIAARFKLLHADEVKVLLQNG